jgi:hypothetical protein
LSAISIGAVQLLEGRIRGGGERVTDHEELEPDYDDPQGVLRADRDAEVHAANAKRSVPCPMESREQDRMRVANELALRLNVERVEKERKDD